MACGAHAPTVERRGMSAPRKAMVFAAGLGARMRPITHTLPKPLVRVAGRTLLDHMLDRLADVGVEEAIVNVHHLADQIERALAGRARPRIVISDERARLLDQGGGVKKALPLLGDAPFFICNTDAAWIETGRPALPALAAAWDPAKMDVLLLTASTTTSIGLDGPGDFLMAPDGRLTKRPQAERAPFVYAGVGVMKPQTFADAEGDVFRLAPYFFAAAERGRLYGAPLDGLWLHVGAPEAIGPAEQAFARSTA